MLRPRAALTATLVATVLLAGCGGDSDRTDDVALDDPLAPVPDGADDGAEPDADGEADTPADDDAGADDPGEGGAPEETVDLRAAAPGPWPAGEAGGLTFALDGDRLVLDDLRTSDGWTSSIEDEDDDEIEVEWSRGDERWTITVELTGRHLEIERTHTLEDVPGGTFAIAELGTVALQVVDGEVDLSDLQVADGWELRDRARGDERELRFTAGDARITLEAEVEDDDDGLLDVRVGHRVRTRR